jgi:hypothetical protein
MSCRAKSSLPVELAQHRAAGFDSLNSASLNLRLSSMSRPSQSLHSRLRFALFEMTNASDHKIAVSFSETRRIWYAMSSLISISKSSEELPVAPLLVLTRTAIGLGLGILLADKIKPPLRQGTAITLLAIGALAAAPWLVKITVGQINRPESEWGSRARLRSIRGASGYTSDDDIY